MINNLLRKADPDWRIWTYHVDYRQRSSESRSKVNVGFWLNGVPRLTVRCALAGHVPLVDGTGPTRLGERAARWVVCGRCGVRPSPQGSLDPDHYPAIGLPYPGDFMPADALPDASKPRARFAALKSLPRHYLPGPWPRWQRGVLGGQLVVLPRSALNVGASIKVGHGGSEHDLACHVSLGRLGSLHLHTEEIGKGVVRWLNPDWDNTYQSRTVSVSVGGGRLRWQLWMPRDGWQKPRRELTRGQRARDGSRPVAPMDLLFGARKNQVTEVAKAGAVVRLPDGDYPVELTLERYEARRPRQRWAGDVSWWVHWSTPRGGRAIPTEFPNRNRIYGSQARMDAASARSGSWPDEAAALIAAWVARHRDRYGWPQPAAPIDDERLQAALRQGE